MEVYKVSLGTRNPEAYRKLLESIAMDAKKHRECLLPKNWRGRILK